MKAEVFSMRITVTAEAIDVRNHVNNLSYLEWCLAAAEGHWEEKASSEMKEKYVWYVLHHSIDYKAPAFEGDLLHVQTWVTKAEGVKSERNYRIERVKDEQLLVEAKTIWCLVDAKSLRPSKISEEMRTLFHA